MATYNGNMKFAATTIGRDGEFRTEYIVLHRRQGESDSQLFDRFREIKNHCKGEISDIESCLRVARILLESGWGLANRCLVSVGPLISV